MTTLLLVAGLLAAVVVYVVDLVLKNEFRWWGGKVADLLVSVATWIVPRAERATRRAEWPAELERLRKEQVPGVLYALQLVIAGMRIRVETTVPGVLHAFQLLIGGMRLQLDTTARSFSPRYAAYGFGERAMCVSRQHIAVFIPYALVCVAALAVGMGMLRIIDATLLLALGVLIRLALRWTRYQADPSEPWHHFGRHVAFWALVFGAGYFLLHVFRFPASLVMVLVVAALLTFRLLEWHCTTYTLTNQRVITSYGVLNRVSESLGIETIQHTTLSRGMVARFFGYGDIVIRSVGKGEEIMKHIADADSFSLAIAAAIAGENVITGGERFEPASPERGSSPMSTEGSYYEAAAGPRWDSHGVNLQCLAGADGDGQHHADDRSEADPPVEGLDYTEIANLDHGWWMPRQ